MWRAFVLCLMFWASGGLSFAQGWTVDPGRGVGPLALEMSPAQIGSQLTPTEYIGSPKNPAFVRYSDEVLVQYTANKAVLITLSKPVINTKAGPVKWTPFSGAGVGIPWNSAVTILGKGYVARDLKTASSQPRETYYAYVSKGLGFRVKAGQIVQVDVFTSR